MKRYVSSIIMIILIGLFVGCTDGDTSDENRTESSEVDASDILPNLDDSESNHSSIANSQEVNAEMGIATSIVLTGSDEATDLLSFEITELPTSGVLTGEAPNMIYTSKIYDVSYFYDSFKFKVNGGEEATVSITVFNCLSTALPVSPVLPIPDGICRDVHRPIADAQTQVVSKNRSKTFTLTGSDVDGDSLTFGIVREPEHGLLDTSFGLPLLVYTPNEDYRGEDSLRFSVSDGVYQSQAEINISVVEILQMPCSPAPCESSTENEIVEYPPIANDQEVWIPKNHAKTITLSATDSNGDALIFELLDTSALHGTVTAELPVVTFTPEEDFVGSESFQFKVHDAISEDNGTVTLHLLDCSQVLFASPYDPTTDAYHACEDISDI